MREKAKDAYKENEGKIEIKKKEEMIEREIQ